MTSIRFSIDETHRLLAMLVTKKPHAQKAQAPDREQLKKDLSGQFKVLYRDSSQKPQSFEALWQVPKRALTPP